VNLGSSIRRARKLVVPGLLCVFAAQDAFAQGCAMCYTSAAGAGSRAAHSLDFGILVLLLPTLVLFLSVIVFTFRRAAGGN
jgi:hypothetical protein